MAAEPVRPEIPVRSRSQSAPRTSYQALTNPSGACLAATANRFIPCGYRPWSTPLNCQRPLPAENAATPAPVRVEGWAIPAVDRMDTPPRLTRRRGPRSAWRPSRVDAAVCAAGSPVICRVTVSPMMTGTRPLGHAASRRAQEDSGNRRRVRDPIRRDGCRWGRSRVRPASAVCAPEPTGPAWLYVRHTSSS